eukprot:Colp12_sorted_trinity150504_noHs@7083
MTHTIILAQADKQVQSRIWADYKSIQEASEGILAMFEERLKVLYPGVKDITYGVKDLFDFLDSLVDISALVYNDKLTAYLPHDREWIKISVERYLQKAQQK